MSLKLTCREAGPTYVSTAECWPEPVSKDAGQTGMNCTMVFFLQDFFFGSLSLSLILLQDQSLASSPDGGERGVTMQIRKRVMTGS